MTFSPETKHSGSDFLSAATMRRSKATAQHCGSEDRNHHDTVMRRNRAAGPVESGEYPQGN